MLFHAESSARTLKIRLWTQVPGFDMQCCADRRGAPTHPLAVIKIPLERLAANKPPQEWLARAGGADERV
jgi:hypothetical protein